MLEVPRMDHLAPTMACSDCRTESKATGAGMVRVLLAEIRRCTELGHLVTVANLPDYDQAADADESLQWTESVRTASANAQASLPEPSPAQNG